MTDSPTEQLLRSLAAERDYVDGQIAVLEERLNAMDKATGLLSETVNRVPTDVQKEVTHLRELDEEKFASIQTQFDERDVRQERESRDNTVKVDAAFAAAKEAATKQDEANQKAIDKAEQQTADTIEKLSELFKTTTDALADKIDDLKARVSDREGRVRGAGQAQEHQGSSNANLIASGAVVVSVLAVLANFVH
jgi:chromosome segregation ATPase